MDARDVDQIIDENAPCSLYIINASDTVSISTHRRLNTTPPHPQTQRLKKQSAKAQEIAEAAAAAPPKIFKSKKH